jgi:hypothetical protein
VRTGQIDLSFREFKGKVKGTYKIQTPPRRNSINVPFKQRMASDQYTIDDMEISSLKGK